jgi:hypothetical protein
MRVFLRDLGECEIEVTGRKPRGQEDLTPSDPGCYVTTSVGVGVVSFG